MGDFQSEINRLQLKMPSPVLLGLEYDFRIVPAGFNTLVTLYTEHQVTQALNKH